MAVARHSTHRHTHQPDRFKLGLLPHACKPAHFTTEIMDLNNKFRKRFETTNGCVPQFCPSFRGNCVYGLTHPWPPSSFTALLEHLGIVLSAPGNGLEELHGLSWCCFDFSNVSTTLSSTPISKLKWEMIQSTFSNPGCVQSRICTAGSGFVQFSWLVP